jgi:hypothetical protein
MVHNIDQIQQTFEAHLIADRKNYFSHRSKDLNSPTSSNQAVSFVDPVFDNFKASKRMSMSSMENGNNMP